MLVLASSFDVKGSIDKALISFSALRGGVSIQGGWVVGHGGGVCSSLCGMIGMYEYVMRREMSSENEGGGRRWLTGTLPSTVS
jgi:hypothetical protein